MEREQIVHRRMRIRSDGLLVVFTVLGLVLAMMLLGYMERTLGLITRPFQFALFVVLLILCYVLISRQMTSFRYVLTETTFSVFRSVGKNQRLAEQVNLEDIVFLSPYLHPAEAKGREYAMCAGKKQDGIIIAHDRNGRRQWLIVSLDDGMLDALKHAKSLRANTGRQ